MIKILALICSGLAAITTLFSSICKTKKNIFLFQCINKIFGVLYTLLLCGYSGMIINILGLVRNFLTLKNKMTKKVQFVLCILMFVIGIVVNNRGILGILPIIASIEYTIMACRNKSTVKIVKYALLINMIMWSIYDFIIKSYPTFIMDIIISLICIKSIVEINKNKQI